MALPDYQKAVRLEPDNEYFHNALVMLYFRIESFEDEAGKSPEYRYRFQAGLMAPCIERSSLSEPFFQKRVLNENHIAK